MIVRSPDLGGLTADSFTGKSIGVVQGDSLEPIAREYADVTGRELIELSASLLHDGAVADVLGRNATVIASANRISRNLLMRFSCDDIWLLTATSPASFLRMLRRMNRQQPSMAYRSVNGVDGTELTSVQPLASLTSEQVDILDINAHGWDCMLHFADGVVCGKRNKPPTEMAGPGIPSCFTAPGTCRRIDVKPEDRIRFSSIRASIIYVNSCRTLRLDHQAGENYWSLALSALDGSAYAYVSSPWILTSHPSGPALFRRELADGASLGDAVSRLNQAIRADGGAFGTFNLIGDGGFCPVSSAGTPAGPVSARPAITLGGSVAPAGPAPVMGADPALSGGSSALPGESSVVDSRLSGVLTVLARLFRSAEQGIDVLASEPLDCLGRIRSATHDWVNGSNGEAQQSEAQLSQWEREASSLQDRAVRFLVDRTSGFRFDYSTEWAEPRRSSEPREVGPCGHCGTGSIWQWYVTYGIWQEPLVVSECSECTEVGSGDPALLTRLSVLAPTQVPLGGTFGVAVEIADDSAATEAITVGATIANEDRYGGNLSAVRTVSRNPDGQWHVTFSGWFDPAESPNVNDRRQVVVFVSHLGRFASAKRPIWVYTPAG